MATNYGDPNYRARLGLSIPNSPGLFQSLQVDDISELTSGHGINMDSNVNLKTIAANTMLSTNGAQTIVGTALTNGQFMIGATGAAPAAATLTSPNSTLTITGGANTLGADLASTVPGAHEFTGALKLDNYYVPPTNVVNVPPNPLVVNNVYHGVMTLSATWNLPITPADGTWIVIVDTNNNWATWPQTLTALGPGVIRGADASGTNTYTMNQNSGWYELQYQSNSSSWTLRANKNWNTALLASNNTWTGTNTFNNTVTLLNNLVADGITSRTATEMVFASSALGGTTGHTHKFSCPAFNSLGLDLYVGVVNYGQLGISNAANNLVNGAAQSDVVVQFSNNDATQSLAIGGPTNTTAILNKSGCTFTGGVIADTYTSRAANTTMTFNGNSTSGTTFTFVGPATTKTGLYIGRGSAECGLAIAQSSGDYVTGTSSGDMIIVPKTVSTPIWLGNTTAMARFTNAAMTVGWTAGASYEMLVNKDTVNNRAWFGWTSNDGTVPFGNYFTKGGGGAQDAWCPGIAANANDFITGSSGNDLCISAKSGQSILLGNGTTQSVKVDSSSNLINSGTTNTTGASTGAVQTSGGLYVAKDQLLSGQLYLSNVTAPTSATGPACITSLNTANTHGPQVVCFGNGDSATSKKFSLLGPRYVGYGTFAAVVLTNNSTWYKMVASPATNGNRWGETSIVGGSGLGVFTAQAAGTYTFSYNPGFPFAAGNSYLIALVKNPTFLGPDVNGSFSYNTGTFIGFMGPILVNAASSSNGSLTITTDLSALDTVAFFAYSYVTNGITCQSGAGTSYRYSADY